MFNIFGKKMNQKNRLLPKSEDFKQEKYINEKSDLTFTLTYFSTVIDSKIIQESILPNLLEKDFSKLDDVKKILPLTNIELARDKREAEKKLLRGYILLTTEKERDRYCLIPAKKEFDRNLSIPEVEFSVIGPKEAFIESISQNINLVRRRLPAKELIVEEFKLGKLSDTKVAVLYLDGIANKEDVNTVKQRIDDIEIDQLVDSSYLTQIISDNRYSPFPQILDTERPDRLTAGLVEGKVGVLVDGSPHALIAPATLIEFFNSFEDYYLHWMLASFIRIIRFFSVAFSVLITPIYVAVLTYHYELIPQDLVGILITSRRVVPFPPFLEALFLELTIELLREAGARLPTKVGQTIGIVGGIVIGTASVEAGMTSNVLLIFIALAALASFTTPVFRIGNTIRLLRFPFLVVANIWGLLGITFLFSFITTHLFRLTSLGRPYMEPLYPLRLRDFKDSIIRLPINKQSTPPFYLRTQDKKRFDKGKARIKKDIDE